MSLDAPPMAGAEAGMQLGLPSGAKIVQMRLLRVGEGPSLELFQFADASQRGAAALPDYGLQHFALYVDDIDEAAARFEAAGGELLSSQRTCRPCGSAQQSLAVWTRALG